MCSRVFILGTIGKVKSTVMQWLGKVSGFIVGTLIIFWLWRELGALSTIIICIAVPAITRTVMAKRSGLK
ncbi:hypothetical protein DYH55_17215 [Methylovirgula sp. 4M-Z18]|nr:hypothetical protein DYH55_17215 [Methylovirgula sp. 4M-Z18]